LSLFNFAVFPKRLALATAGLGFLGLGVFVALWQQPRPPAELQEVQRISHQLLMANQLHISPLHFALRVGSQAPYWAEKAGLCKSTEKEKQEGDPCEFWAERAPGPSQAPLQQEVNRLAYLTGSAYAHTYSHGLVMFDRSFFLVHERDPDALRCVVAHELSHFLRKHAYRSSLQAHGPLADLSEDQRNLKLAALSQQQELEADREAMRLVAIAGHNPDTCVNWLQRSAELDGDAPPEDPKGTHPGLKRRLSEGRAYLKGPLARELAVWKTKHPKKEFQPKGQPRWQWNQADSLLTVYTR